MARLVKSLTPLASLLVVLAVAWYAAKALPGSRTGEHHDIGSYSLTRGPRAEWEIAFWLLIWLASYAAGVNETALGAAERSVRSAGAVFTSIIAISLAQTLARASYVPLFVLGSTAILLIPIQTFVASFADRRLVRQGQQERVLALVSPQEADRLCHDLEQHPERPSQLVLAVSPVELSPSAEHPMPLLDLVEEHRATLIVMAREAQAIDEVVAQLVIAHSRGIRIRTLSLFYDEWLGKLPIAELERIALLFDINEIHRPVYARLKRSIDVAFGLAGFVALVVAIPIVLVVDLFGNRGPLFYRQPRVGKDGTVFTIWKFRTMRPSTDAPTTWTAENDPRLGTVGKALRKLHIDELPQVVNVLKKDMSVVGPRPEQPHYVEQLRASIPFYDVRHLVRPGITGWAQVKYDYGASEVDAMEKLQYEFYYLRHQDLALDLRTMGRTLRSMVWGGR